MEDARQTPAGRHVTARVVGSTAEAGGRGPEGYDVASAEARAGRRGLLDSGPHAPVRKGRGLGQVLDELAALVREEG